MNIENESVHTTTLQERLVEMKHGHVEVTQNYEKYNKETKIYK